MTRAEKIFWNFFAIAIALIWSSLLGALFKFSIFMVVVVALLGVLLLQVWEW